MRALVAVTALLALCACGDATGHVARPAARATPTRTPVTSGPLAAEAWLKASTGIFLGGDDHVSVVVQNLGRDITDLAIGMGLRDSWLGEHQIAMGTSSSCEIDQQLGGFDCGPVPSGESVSFQLRAVPDQVGTFSYAAAFFDRSTGGLQQIKGSGGADLVVAWTETVTPIAQQH